MSAEAITAGNRIIHLRRHLGWLNQNIPDSLVRMLRVIVLDLLIDDISQPLLAEDMGSFDEGVATVDSGQMQATANCLAGGGALRPRSESSALEPGDGQVENVGSKVRVCDVMRRPMISIVLLGGLLLAPVTWAAAAVAQEAATPDVVDAQETGDDQPDVESPVSDPEIADIPALDNSNFLFGDWGGWRSERAAEGITFDIQWTQTAQGVTDGGMDTGFRYGGTLDYLVQFDLEAMDIQPGAFVKVLAESRYGESINGDVGSILPANTDLSFPLTDELDEDIAVTVTELSFTQFFSPKFGVVLGKIQTLDGDANEFASGRGRSQFLNANLVFNPVTSLTVPYSTLGAGIVLLPSPNVTVTSLVMNTTDASTTTGFDDVGDGWTWTTEAQFQYRLRGLPGGQNIAFIYAADSEFLNFRRSDLLEDEALLANEDETWAAYWSGWQYLYTLDEVADRIDVADGRPDVRGMGLFSRIGIADDDTNPIEWSFSGGVGGRGVLPGRDEDTFGLGFSYANIDRSPFVSSLGLAEEAYGVEAYYSLALSAGVALTVDAQVVDPVIDDVDTATILGVRLNVRF